MAVACPSAGTYTRRTPEHTVLYRVVEQYLPLFVARAEDNDQAGRLPKSYLLTAIISCPTVSALP